MIYEWSTSFTSSWLESNTPVGNMPEHALTGAAWKRFRREAQSGGVEM